MKLPTIQDLTALVRDVKLDIEDDFIAEGDDRPSIDLTVGCDCETGDWSYQTGDNSFTGGAYGYPDWAVVTVHRRSNSVELAREIRDQLADLASQ